MDPVDVRSGKRLNIIDLMQQKIIFHVDTFEAIADDNYFIDLVNQSLKTHESRISLPLGILQKNIAISNEAEMIQSDLMV